MIEIENKNILVLGLQKSGLAAVELLKTKKTNIFISDKKIIQEIPETIYIPYDELKNNLSKMDLIVKSPGIPYDIDLLKYARSKKIPIISEIELAYQFINKEKVIIAVTGTNGKTTTTTLISKILRDSNIEVTSCGNNGYAFSQAILESNKADVFVVELSSFQLMDIYEFKPHIAIILNIDEAHLDYHKNFSQYVNAKLKIFSNLDEDSQLIYNAENEILRKRTKKLKCQKLTFSLSNKKTDIYIDNDRIIYQGLEVMTLSDINLLGKHNYENVLAAIACAKVCYIENMAIKNSICSFTGLPHRLQFIRKINGVSYYNDSKSTNIKSTLRAIESFNQELYLILGGYERNQDFYEIIKHENIKKIFAFGQTQYRIISICQELNKIGYLCHNLKEAVHLAHMITEKNDIVLFSPASASWDQYESYEIRGKHFIDIVNQLQDSS